MDRPARKEGADGADRRDAGDADGDNSSNQILLLAIGPAGVELPDSCNGSHNGADEEDVSSDEFAHMNLFLARSVCKCVFGVPGACCLLAPKRGALGARRVIAALVVTQRNAAMTQGAPNAAAQTRCIPIPKGQLTNRPTP